MPTPLQLRMIHVAARQAGLIDADGDARYRLLLNNVAGADSAKSLDQSEFEDVMEVIEAMGFVDTKGAGYWANKVALRRSCANPRMVRKIIELQKQQDRYPLASVCLRHSDGRTDRVEQLLPREAWKVIEMLKAVVERENRHAAAAVQEDLPF